MTKPLSTIPWGSLITITIVCAVAYGSYEYLMRIAKSPAQATAATPVSAPTAPATLPALPLAESERKYLWDTEHEAFVLTNVVFPEMAAAVRDNEQRKLARRFDEKVAAWLPADEPVVNEEEKWIVQRWQADDHTKMSQSDRTGVIEHLWELRGRVANLAGVQWSLMQLSPDQRENFDGPWNGTTVIRLWGHGGSGEPAEVELRASFRMAEKPDRPSGEVAPITEWKITALRFARAREFLMRETAAERGIDVRHFYDNWNFPDEMPRLVTGGLYVSDYDDDGWLDILITDWNGHRLYRGQEGGKFIDVTQSAGLAVQEVAGPAPAIFADIDGDGRLDLILGDRMLRNTGDGRFEPVPSQSTLPLDVASFAVGDYDRDGRVDLYMARGSRGPTATSRRISWLGDESGPGNILWRNLGDWKFEDVTAATQSGAGHRSCFSAIWFDADTDGWPDLFVGDEFGSPVLLINRRGRRFEQQSIGGIFGGFCMGAAAGDIDNDGRIDLYLANMYSKAGNRIFENLDPKSYEPEIYAKIREFTRGSELYMNRGKLQFEKTGRQAGVASVGWAYGPCIADLDNDGWLDIYAPAGFQSVSRVQPDG